ncbi:unnamed protein product [Thelazia callipaeda]|uniref:OAR domain-containing protein n=1 Tax=Thelazia callipaeda TaxID=103827 RepID=A0A0N5D6N9_THECL|nr:unnamed protein product [Thelazia callipaeda]
MDDLWLRNGSNANKMLMIPPSHPSQWPMYPLDNSGQIPVNFGHISGTASNNITSYDSVVTSISCNQRQNIHSSSIIPKHSVSSAGNNDRNTTSSATTTIATTIKNVKMEQTLPANTVRSYSHLI